MSDPRRLLDTSRPGTLARVLLDSHPVREPTEREIGVVWGGLAVRLGPSGGAAPSAGGKLLALGGSASALAIVAAVVGVALRPGALPAGSAHAVDPRPSAPAQVAPPAASLDRDTPAASTDAVPAAPPASSSSSIAAAAVHPARPRPVADPGSTLRVEAELLVRARASVRAGDCAGALGQLDGLRARFPSSALAQEREVLAIQALACAGRSDQASGRAAAFLRDHPDSPHAAEVERFVAR
jgi:hypothetical protein